MSAMFAQGLPIAASYEALSSFQKRCWRIPTRRPLAVPAVAVTHGFPWHRRLRRPASRRLARLSRGRRHLEEAPCRQPSRRRGKTEPLPGIPERAQAEAVVAEVEEVEVPKAPTTRTLLDSSPVATPRTSFTSIVTSKTRTSGTSSTISVPR